MNLFICKCKDDNNEEKNAINLLNIKNLENSIKKEAKKLKIENYNNMETSNKDIIINNLNDDLEIIDYPYELKQEKKIINNTNHIQQIKLNIINKNNKLFNNKKEITIKEIKKKSDLNSSSLNNESLIIDDMEDLTDEDSLKIHKEENKKIILKSIKIQQKNINNIKCVNTNKSPNNNNNLNKKIKIKNYITEASTKDSKNKIFHNESFKSNTTGVSTLKKKVNKDKRILSTEKNKKSVNKKYLDKYNDYQEFKNLLNKTFEEFSKSNRKNFLSAKKSVKTYFKNKKIVFNDNSTNNIKQKETKDKNMKNDISGKRINKRKVLFKKINLNCAKFK